MGTSSAPAGGNRRRSKTAPLNPVASKTKRSYAGVAQEQRKQLRRERLIQAAVEVFGSLGYHAATVRTVCGQAQLTERYFYESFKSLDQLFSSVYAELNSQLKQATLDALAKTLPEPLELAQAALRVFLQFIQDDPRRARIILIDAVSTGRIGREAADEAARDYIDMMRSFVGMLFPQTQQLGVNSNLLAEGLVGLNIHIATTWVREGFATPLEQVLWNNMLPYRGLASLMQAPPEVPKSASKPKRKKALADDAKSK